MSTLPISSSRNLAAALAAFQAVMPAVPKSKTASMEKYSYSYAGLAEVVAVAAPLMAEHGLSFSCVPMVDESGRITLTGVLMHDSGEQITGSLPISGGAPQQVGSALTYARRYLLGCMAGIVTDDDDDGQMASRKQPKKQAAAGPTQTVRRKPAVSGRPVTDVPLPDTAPEAVQSNPTQVWQPEPWRGEPPAGNPHAAQQVAPGAPDSAPVAPVVSDSLRRSLMAASSRVGIDPTLDRDTRLALWSALLARRVTTTNDLTRDEALTLLRRLNDVETGAVEWDLSTETGAVRLRHVDREP